MFYACRRWTEVFVFVIIFYDEKLLTGLNGSSHQIRGIDFLECNLS